MIEDTDQWLAIRKEAAAKIDAEAAEVHWEFGSVTDPYGVYGDTVDQESCVVGRNYFARSPESDVWVWFGDLPAAVRDALWQKHKRQLVAFPAELVSIEVITGKEPQNLIVAGGNVRPNTVYVLAGLYDDKPGRVALMGWEWGHTLLKAPTQDFGCVLSHYIPRNELRSMSELEAHRAAWQAWQSVMGRPHGRA